jgi:hypothetical protein
LPCRDASQAETRGADVAEDPIHGVASLAVPVGWEPGYAYAPFVPVIVLATVTLGLIPGLVALLLGWLLAIYSFVEPVGLLSLDDWDDVAYAIMFPAVAACVSVLIEVLRVMSGEGEHR